jgi:methyl-accepting chemotaxis protein
MGNLKIGARLGIAFGVLLLLSILTTGIALWRLQSAASTTQQMMAEPLTKERMISEWNTNIQVAARRTMAIVKSTDPSLSSFFAEDAARSVQATTELQKKVDDLTNEPEEQAEVDKIGELRKAYLGSRDKVQEAKKAGNTAEAERLFNEEFVPASKAYAAGVADLLARQRTKIDAMAKQIESANEVSRVLLPVLALLSLVLSGALAWIITRSITRPVDSALSAARRVASGDLSVSLVARTQDEMGQLVQALADMQNSLSGMIRGIRQSTDSISTASTEIATGNQDLSQRTEQTASNLQEAASSMEQLNGTVKQTADSARTANQLASSASSVAVKGGEVVSQVVSTMDEISASSKKISDIIGVIDGIAFQTNILALNAAVEAARAGEQGRGFAVVASEVRNLAQRSAQAAKEIKTLISASVERVESGSRLVADAGQTMSEIVNSVQRVSDIIGEITAAASEQSDGIGQVNASVTHLDQMTQQNAALVEQSAAAAESLREQAMRLAGTVQQFRLA